MKSNSVLDDHEALNCNEQACCKSRILWSPILRTDENQRQSYRTENHLDSVRLCCNG